MSFISGFSGYEIRLYIICSTECIHKNIFIQLSVYAKTPTWFILSHNQPHEQLRSIIYLVNDNKSLNFCLRVRACSKHVYVCSRYKKYSLSTYPLSDVL